MANGVSRISQPSAVTPNCLFRVIAAPSIEERYHHASLPAAAQVQGILEPMRLHMGPPLRPRSQLNQIRVALPTRFSSGTKPQLRPSSLLSRLSPIIR